MTFAFNGQQKAAEGSKTQQVQPQGATAPVNKQQVELK